MDDGSQDEYAITDALVLKRKAPPTVFKFDITIGDDSLLKAQRKVKGTAAQDLCMQMIQALDEHEVLGHSRRILRPRRKLSRPGQSTANTTDNEMTSDEESIPNRHEIA
ncbi:hypothetical protein N7471_010651 [Penicillium samsonianum]|uniref:uncharacterized protein n=1 Tax=Penicillium samsonianum TaxID=1882272 RepID=UPI002548F48A|nr:uncharacterized protein N7471_010651 [Penicillium samsonianum]KAJ6126158.1 hypothetical protein N7471_010651 [Penicillium samsonianum]